MGFFTHSSKKICGSQCQKFMFVDGDKAISGSYRSDSSQTSVLVFVFLFVITKAITVLGLVLHFPDHTI